MAAGKIQNPKSKIQILFALIVAILPHIVRLPLWIILWCAGMWGYLVLSLRFGWPGPGKVIRRVLAAMGILGLLLTYSVRLGPDAFLGLLAIMAALKPFEIHSHRDRMVTVFVAYFIVITSLFQSETLAITLYMFVSVGITTAVLIRINDPEGRFKHNLKIAAVIMAQAIPLMVVLFLLFPRIQGSLFGLSMMGKAKSGFSDIMSPGSVSMLVENDELAFRAEFDGPMPPPELLYWRGIVFENFDGRRWTTEKRTPETSAPPSGRQAVAYTINLEPHRERWLFALEMPAEIPQSAILYADNTLRSRHPVFKTLRYRMTSNTQYDGGARYENQDHLDHLTRLPEGDNPRATHLALELTQNAPGVDEKIERMLKFFAKGGFLYTLRPPLLGRHPVDSFLFESKKGYCEHYASAFVVMMRAAGVPARIVGGYLGGEANPYGNFLMVRQTDAHAWAEVWHPVKGWLRVDPTGAVAPERITSGMEAALAAGEVPGMAMRKYFGGLAGIYDQVRFGWEAMNARWNAWFEGYSYEQQRELLKKIGITAGNWAASLKALALLLLLLVMATAAAIAFIVLRPPERKPDAIGKYYTLFCKKLARAGLGRKPGMGPLDYAAYVSKTRPDLARRMGEITDLYVGLRYQGQPSKSALENFKKRIKAFNPNAQTF